MFVPFAHETPEQALLVQAALQGNLAEVMRLSELTDPSCDCSKPLRVAASQGHAACVEFLIPRSNPQDLFNSALVEAAQNGHAGCVALLLPVSNPLDENCEAITCAARQGHHECVQLLVASFEQRDQTEYCDALNSAVGSGCDQSVRLLLNGSSEHEHNAALNTAAYWGYTALVEEIIPFAGDEGRQNALIQASEHGRTDIVRALAPLVNSEHHKYISLIRATLGDHKDCVAQLLEVCDATANSSMALRVAINNGKSEMMEQLLPYSNAQEAWSGVSQAQRNSAVGMHFQNLVARQRLKKAVERPEGSPSSPAPARKI